MIYIFLASLVTSFSLTYFVIPSIVNLSKAKRLFDYPDERKLNKVVVPTMGGVGIFIGLTVSSILFIQPGSAGELRYLLLAVMIMFFVGIKDDMLTISARKKFILQFVVALILVLWGDFCITQPYGLFNAELFSNWISIPLSVLMFVFLINALNLIDGIDGLAAGIALAVSLFLGIWFFLAGHLNYAVVCMALTGSLIAYLRFNVFGRKNKIFMGDTTLVKYTGRFSQGAQAFCQERCISFIHFQRGNVSMNKQKSCNLQASSLWEFLPYLYHGLPVFFYGK